MKAEPVDISKTTIDLFFANRHFPIPEFMPTDSMRRTTGQLNECNVKVDSLTSRCYLYDEKSRVVQMIIRHKWTLHQYAYTYDDKGRVGEINSIDHEVYTPIYNSDGTLQELTKKSEFLKKRLVFLYD
jgi:YD repeat-containing protein